MIQAAEKLLKNLQQQLDRLNGPGLCLNQIEECFVSCNNAILGLGKRLKRQKFESIENEIDFFRSVKPRFVCLQRYYVMLYNHVLFLPEEPNEKLRYLERSLQKTNRYLVEHYWFFSYVQSGATHLDHEYFVRHDVNQFSTTGEVLISEIHAHRAMAEYLRQEIVQVRAEQ